MQPHVLDLFGEVIITHSDIRLWMLTVPRIDPDSHRALSYIRSYDVVGKIRRAKLSGTFEHSTRPAHD
ncbi:hypothetical protein BH10PSE16_BH10PSE16_43810 [soil metagenome]